MRRTGTYIGGVVLASLLVFMIGSLPVHGQSGLGAPANVGAGVARAERASVFRLTKRQAPRTNLANPSQPAADCSGDDIGLMLPLTGGHGAMGKAMLDAATLALFDLSDGRLKLRPFDTKGSAEGSAAAAHAIAQSHACIIVGPVFDYEVQIVRDRIRPEQSPMIAFSSNRSVASEEVVLLNFLPEQQLREILTFSADQGKRRVGVVIPNDRYGELLEFAIEPLAAELGLEIVFIRRVDLDFSTISEQISQVAELIHLSDDETESNPRGGGYAVDVLVLPVPADWAIVLSALLEVHDVDLTDVQLLGTGLWLGASLEREPPLQGAWFAGPSMESFGRFADRVETHFGYRPPMVAALAYDAVLLAGTIQQAKFEGRKTRELLFWPDGLKGVLGAFWVQPGGSVVRELTVFEQTANGQHAITAR